MGWGISSDEKIKPLVIFGAGASYDLIDDKDFINSEHRPPLADEIFKNNKFFKEIQLKYPRINGLIGLARNKMKDKGLETKSLEEVLDEIQNDKRDKVVFEEEIMVLKRYLTKLFLEISNTNNFPGDNYDTFFRLMNQVCDNYYVVNFNYDTLAQKAIENNLGKRFENIDSYIENKIKLIHVHGSVIWNRNINGSIELYGTRNQGAEIIIPTIGGKKFMCPDNHIKALRQCLKEVNAIIIIGWKGTEDHFKKLLEENISDTSKRVILVGGGEESNIDTLRRSGLDKFYSHEKVYIKGFSNLLKIFPDFSMNLRDDMSGNVKYF